jgi:hypothetical protein
MEEVAQEPKRSEYKIGGVERLSKTPLTGVESSAENRPHIEAHHVVVFV